MATSGLGLLGPPVPHPRLSGVPCPDGTSLDPPTASDGSGRNARERPLERGVPRTQWEAEPPHCLPWTGHATPTHRPGKGRAQHHVVRRRRWRSATQCDAVRRGSVHCTRGGIAPPDPPSLVGGAHLPPAERADSRDEGRKNVCVCVVVVVEIH